MSGEAVERAAAEAPDMTIRVTGRVHRELLTIQYRRRMAGEYVSLSEIIGQLLAERPVKP